VVTGGNLSCSKIAYGLVVAFLSVLAVELLEVGSFDLRDVRDQLIVLNQVV